MTARHGQHQDTGASSEGRGEVAGQDLPAVSTEVTGATITDDQIKILLRGSGPSADTYEKLRRALDRRLSARNRAVARHFAALHWNARKVAES